MFRPLLTAATLLALSTTAMAQSPKVVSLTSKTVTKQNSLSAKFNGTPLLQAFNLRFLRDDHHIRTLGVLPERNRVTALYADKNGDDAFRWTARFVTLDHPGIILGEVRDELQIGSVTRHLDAPKGDYVFVLRGFKLNYGQNRVGYGGKDHHIDEVGVWEINGQLHVAFNDKNNDDPFAYHVKYAYVPSQLFVTAVAPNGIARGEAALRPTTAKGIPVICGFSFDYAKADHHLRQIGVDAKDSNLVTSYFDKNRDDRFGWSVRLGLLKESQPTSTGSKTTPSIPSRVLRSRFILNARTSK